MCFPQWLPCISLVLYFAWCREDVIQDHWLYNAKFYFYYIAVHVAFYAATVVLDSNMGSRQICPGEVVTYTCNVNQGTTLTWIVESFLPSSTRIQFMATADTGSILNCNDVPTLECVKLQFVATLTNIANPTNVTGVTVADITSTLAFTATARLNGTLVQCRGTNINGFLTKSTTHTIAGICIYIVE